MDERILEIIEERVLVLDGAMGTELQSMGMPEGVCPELWCVQNPEVLKSIHRAYRDSGSNAVYTSSFGANRFKLAQYGIEDVVGLNRRLAELAREAVGDDTFVAGDISSTGRFVEPFGDLSFDDAVDAYKEQVQGLLDGGVDLFIIETMIDIQEARAALIAVRELCDVFTMVTMTYESGGRTLNGTDPLTALVTLQSLGADAVGCNCSTGPEGMIPFIKTMKPYATVPLVAKPNAGLPRLVDGETVFDMDPSEFAAYATEFVDAGINIMGGCCGTTPAHIGALARELEGKTPSMPVRKPLSAVSSARSTVLLEKDGPLKVIGERINPTGKKALQAELKEGKTSIVRRFAGEQKDASILDVNVGMSGIDEKAKNREIVKFLTVNSDMPLSIDSSSVDVIESSLRVYPGRALINSISGEHGKMEILGPVAAKYGAMFILLPIEGGSVPKTAEERADISRSLFEKAQEYGFTKDDVIIDALAMAVSADQDASFETLETIRWCSETFGCLSVLGLSNVSFGLPERRWINAAFMSMCIDRGLNLAIANPTNEELMGIKFASDVLRRRDIESKEYIAHFSGAKKAEPAAAKETLPPEKRVFEAILDGNREDVGTIIDEALGSVSASELVEKYMVPAIGEVGDRYDKKVYFLPQLIASAETMKGGFEHIEPLLRESGAEIKSRGKVLFATVQGDIHDIGKNIVVLMLKNHGFEVIDLGKDVKHEVLIEAIKKYEPDIVGLSALMTTTMGNMKDAVEMARSEGINCRFMVGGAVVTKAFAESIGAFYSSDGVDACRVADELMSGE